MIKHTYSPRLVISVPTGWSGQRYGIPDDIVNQVDRTTLWALVCASEAFANSGFSDVYGKSPIYFESSWIAPANCQLSA